MQIREEVFTVLPLDSPRWSELRHAYGDASDIPPLLKLLQQESYGAEDIWESLWSSLCHQGDAYDASYAAMPHLVAIAIATKGPLHWSYFSLPAGIEIARGRGRAPRVPSFLFEAYMNALQQLHECAFKRRKDNWDDGMALCILAALAAAKGRYDVAEAIYVLDENLVDRLVARDFDYFEPKGVS